ncbi:MAG: hypothetical protein QXM31_02750 [Candidatus Woesearchaeota archaeon]
MAKPRYLEADNLANALEGIAMVLEKHAAAINRGKQLSPEDVSGYDAFAATLRSAAKELLEQQKEIREGVAAIRQINKELGFRK